MHEWPCLAGSLLLLREQFHVYSRNALANTYFVIDMQENAVTIESSPVMVVKLSLFSIKRQRLQRRLC